MKTMFQKVWEQHEVVPETPDTPAVLYIDRHLIHEVTSPQAFTVLRERGLAMRRPERTLATIDHSSPTRSDQIFGGVPIAIESAALQIAQLQRNCAEFGVELLDLKSDQRGIVHIIGPEFGFTQPGQTIVCGDSHTSTHGAFGALAFGIGTTEVGHVLATQCLLQRRPRTFAITVDGALSAGVTAKDLILSIIGEIGIGGGTGYVLEYRGAVMRSLSMEERMTVCNMSIEAGARAGMIAPDETTYRYLKSRPRSPQGAAWERALSRWRSLPSDADATFDRELRLDGGKLEPMITYGTNPGMVIAVTGSIPAAQLLRGHKIARGVRALVVPGSQQVKKAAEAEGLDRIFIDAGAEWRESGCSMCIGMNGDTVGSGQYSISTSNRNFEGRQGPGARTLLASPLTAAASAVRGRVTDPRDFLDG
jgi:3-isopropylmalate/(R)-2-methylmalate dehydratase large subunit